jgi:hypothetical protein
MYVSRPFFRRALASACLALLALLPTSVAAQSPHIDGISAGTLTRSGRLVLTGTDFGAVQGSGQVLVDGAACIATTWTDTEVHAYVPESAGPGLVSVVVTTGAGASNSVLLLVTLRQPDGRFRWRFQFDSDNPGSWTAVGEDGTIYATDDTRLYALAPDGALRWVLAGAGGGRPITFGADGTLYTGRADVVAVNPDGTLKWQFVFPAGPGELLCGPGVGPDGNIYGLDNSLLGGNGAFALDPTGQLLWTNPGPSSTSGSKTRISFAADRFYAAYASDAGAPPALRVYDYDGDELWSAAQLQLAVGSVPEIDPQDRLVLSWGMNGVQTLSPDGDIVWKIQPGPLGGLIVPPTVGPDGTIYAGTWLSGDLWAGNPDGSTRWSIENEIGGFIGVLSVAPDNTVLIDGGSPGFGNSSFIRGFSTADGELLWQQDFQPETGLNQLAWWSDVSYASDGATAYVPTKFTSSGNEGYVYAVDITTGGVGTWTDLGQSLAGTHGLPVATGTGTLVAGDTFSVGLANALENTLAYGVVSTQLLNAPFLGGVLVPDLASGSLVPRATDATGSVLVVGSWPTGVPSGSNLYVQWWIVDAAGPQGFAASNGLRASTP